MSNNSQDTLPVPVSTDPAKIKVAFSGLGNKLFFAFKGHTKMKKVMELFAKNTDFPVNQLTFNFEGRTIRGDDTPDKIGLSDSDIIEVFQQVDGGFISTLLDGAGLVFVD